jgi:hypothetical protein
LTRQVIDRRRFDPHDGAMTTTDTTTETTTTTTQTSDTEQERSLAATIDGYFACWNTTDAAERRRLVEATWAPEARNVDPVLDATGHDALTDMFAGFHDTYAGHSFRPLGTADEHHGLARWGWEMVDPDGNVVLDGIDVAMVSDGRIAYLVGFFGSRLPDA